MGSNKGNFVNVIRNGKSIFVPFENIKAGDTVLLHNAAATRFTAKDDAFMLRYVKSVEGMVYKESDVEHYQEMFLLYDEDRWPSFRVFHCETAYRGFNIFTAIREAAIDFCNTETGRVIFQQQKGFTWKDFLRFVPDEICEAHGFLIYEKGKSLHGALINEHILTETDGELV